MVMFSDDIIIPISLGVLAGVSLLFNIFQHNKITALASSGGEFASICRQAKTQDNPVCILVDKGNNGIPFIGTVSEKNDAMLEGPKKKNKNLANTKFNLVAPQAAQTNSQIDIKGVGKVSIFTNPQHFPTNIHSSAALCAYGAKIENDPFLRKFRNPLKMLELGFNRTGTYREECRKYIYTSVEFNLENGNSVAIPFTPRSYEKDV